MRRFSALVPLSLVSLSVLAGCPMPTTGLAAAQQAAQDFNLDSRFGRNEMVLEQVAPAEREEYALHHKAWGTTIRVADVEIAGMKAHGDKDVDIVVHVDVVPPRAAGAGEHDAQAGVARQDERLGARLRETARRRHGPAGRDGRHRGAAGAARPAQFPTVRLNGADPAQQD